ncbi:MAG TPA: hypothetical protein VIF62_00015, partial [Labilithrix sp.]
MMAGSSGSANRHLRTARTIALFVAAYAIAFAAARAGVYLRHAIWLDYHDQPWMLASIETLYEVVATVAGASYDVTLGVATILAPLGLLARRL